MIDVLGISKEEKKGNLLKKKKEEKRKEDTRVPVSLSLSSTSTCR
jgi:hypothetical protein